jgi:hypothetical protein
MAKHKAFLITNFSLGFFSWFMYWSSYSFRTRELNFWFPYIVGILAFVSLKLVRLGKVRVSKFLTRFAIWPGLIGAIAAFAFVITTYLPPFTLGTLFYQSEVANEEMVTSVASPDKQLIAEVIFRPVGAYAPGAGKVFVRIIWNAFPFVQRHEFFSTVYSVPEEGYAEWIDNDSLHISEPDSVLSIAKPNLAAIAIWIIGIVVILAQPLEDSKK